MISYTMISYNIYIYIETMYDIHTIHFADGFTCITTSDDETNIPLPSITAIIMLPITENVTHHIYRLFSI